MSTIFDFFPYLIFLIPVLSLWNLYDQYRFTRFEGNLKRGLMIWAEPLSWETRQFLQSLPSSVQLEQSFIRKEINEVLIVEKRSFGRSFFNWRNSLSYVGYVNLSTLENQIEFRTPLATLISLTVSLIVILFFLQLFYRSGASLPVFMWFLPVIILLMYIGSYISNLHQERKRILNLLNRAMRQQSQ